MKLPAIGTRVNVRGTEYVVSDGETVIPVDLEQSLDQLKTIIDQATKLQAELEKRLSGVDATLKSAKRLQRQLFDRIIRENIIREFD